LNAGIGFISKRGKVQKDIGSVMSKGVFPNYDTIRSIYSYLPTNVLGQVTRVRIIIEDRLPFILNVQSQVVTARPSTDVADVVANDKLVVV